MSKINNMATQKERESLSNNIIELKQALGLTYSEMIRKLGKPCRASTLQIRAKYPNKECSSKLYDKILLGIKGLEEYKTEKEKFEQIKKEFREELTNLTNVYFRKVELFYGH